MCNVSYCWKKSLDISDTTAARKLNLKLLLDMVKYRLWIQELLYYTIQHEGGRHIDFRQMSISPGQLRLTTARWLSAYMLSRALATTTASNNIYYLSSLVQFVTQFIVSGSYQSGAPYNIYPAGPAVPAPGQGPYIHVYQTTPSVVIIGGCPACRVCSVSLHL